MFATPDLDGVFKALGDRTRRAIVERLQESPATTGSLIEAFPTLSRAAVMKHLGVLEEAGLVRVRREGKFRWNQLEADPLAVADDWLSKHIDRRRNMMMRLKEIAEEKRDNA